MGEITFYEKDGITYFSCGCKTQTIGKNFIINPCSLDCVVYIFCLEESIKQGNVINHVTTE